MLSLNEPCSEGLLNARAGEVLFYLLAEGRSQLAVVPLFAISPTSNSSSLTFYFIYLFFFLRDSASRGGAETQGDTESEAGFRLRAVSTDPDAGLEPMNREIMT